MTACFRPTILLAAVLAALPAVPRAGLATEARTKAPGFRAVDLEGERFTLDDLLGKGPIVIDFWATWCKPCIKELPYVQRLQDDFADRGVQVLAVTIDSPKSQNQVRKFVKTRDYSLRVVMDGEQDVFRKMQGKGTIPYVVILDRDGYIRYHHTGYRPGDEKELTRVVTELLAEAGSEAPGDVERDEPATDGVEEAPTDTGENAG